jgi:hypothetical protein
VLAEQTTRTASDVTDVVSHSTHCFGCKLQKDVLEVDLRATFGALEEPHPCVDEGFWDNRLDEALKARSTEEA